MSLNDYTVRRNLPGNPVSPRGAIVIVVYNNTDDIDPCLASLREHAPDDVTVVVVDNGSREDLIEGIRERNPEVHGFRVDPNFGITRANNVGARYAMENGAKRVYFLNDDTAVLSGFWEAIEEEAEANRAAIVGSLPLDYYNPDRIEAAGMTISPHDLRTRSRGIGAKLDSSFDPFYPCDAVVGCGWMVEARVFEAVGPFDESFFMYHEEVEFCLRAKAAGFKAGLAGRSRILHKGGGTAVHISAMYVFFFLRNFIWMSRIHCSPRDFRRYTRLGALRIFASFFRRHPSFRKSPRCWRAALRGTRDGFRIEPGTFYHAEW